MASFGRQSLAAILGFIMASAIIAAFFCRPLACAGSVELRQKCLPLFQLYFHAGREQAPGLEKAPFRCPMDRPIQNIANSSPS